MMGREIPPGSKGTGEHMGSHKKPASTPIQFEEEVMSLWGRVDIRYV